MNNFISVDGIHIYVERQGKGARLLMIPGLAAGTWLWTKNVDELSLHFELIMPELRGSGRSDKPDHRYSIACFASDLKSLLEQFDIYKVNILGASLGGFVAQYFAANWPELVNSLVLIGTSLGGENQIGPDGDVLCRTIRPHGRTKHERLESVYSFNFTKEYINKYPEELGNITNWRIQYPQPEFAYYRQLLAGYAYNGLNLVEKIAAPTLICAGKQDPLVPDENAHLLHRKIPHSKLLLFEGKHMFFFEKSRQFNQAIIDFIKNHAHDFKDRKIASYQTNQQF
ncbi:MAG: alpha/beta fold hydrolase [bacterium]